ncbi:unnamed protein product [Sphagnum balticum]
MAVVAVGPRVWWLGSGSESAAATGATKWVEPCRVKPKCSSTKTHTIMHQDCDRRGRHDLRLMAVSFQGLRTTTFVGGRRRRHELGGMNPQESRWKRRFRTRRTPAAFPSRAAAHCATMPVCSMMNIVFVSAEVAPWSKTGGLGDVLSGLPPALAALGHRVMTISPRYDQYKDAWDTDVTVADQKETIRFFHCFKRGVDRVFVDHPRFLAKVRGKTRSKLYGPTTGVDYYDNQFRFCLLAKVKRSDTTYLSISPCENVVFVANDWHTALLPCYLKSIYKSSGQFPSAKVAFCVHNIAYQGRFAFSDFQQLGLPEEFISSFEFYDSFLTTMTSSRCPPLRKKRKINWMKAALLESDIVLTVSPNYAKELTAGPDKGVELDTIVSKAGVLGIVNGMDVQEWDPLEDEHLSIRYNCNTVVAAKPLLKEALQAEVGLPINPTVPLLGFIGRLEEQKGSDILAEATSDFLKEDIQLIVLGTGKKSLEQQLEQLVFKFPDKARSIMKFNTPLAHMITAGVDYMLVPSRFEPCGLIQLHAMRYGTVPIVASTGGLVDTVQDGVNGFHIGRAFNINCERIYAEDVEALTSAIKRAAKVYGTAEYTRMSQVCMSQDLSWKGPARKWEEALLGLQVYCSTAGQDGDKNAPKAPATLTSP